jgi:hypothetical protein
MGRRSSIILGLVILLFPPGVGSEDDGRIPALAMGAIDPTRNPFTACFIEDPQFTYSAYLLGGAEFMRMTKEERRKLDRRYYPRTGRELVGSYDIIVFCAARFEHFTPGQFQDLHDAFTEEGIVGVASPGTSWDTVWVPTILSEVIPIWGSFNYAPNRPYRVVFRREVEPVFHPFIELGMERVMGNNYHEMNPKRGSTIWADMSSSGLPWLISWRPGGSEAGMFWIFTGIFDVPWWGLASGSGGQNPYAIDLVTNLIFRSLDLPLVGNIHARRKARLELTGFQSQKLLVLSLMEWADSFGTNIIPLVEQLNEVEEEAEGAMDYYIDGDYGSAISLMESMREEIADITVLAVRMKNEAMYWIYISEWLAITSTSILSILGIWTLMVRRRLYRDVDWTRLSSR